MKKAIVTALTEKAQAAEITHRRAAMAEKYGQAAYNQGLRDGLIAAAALVLAAQAAPEAPEAVTPDGEQPATSEVV